MADKPNGKLKAVPEDVNVPDGDKVDSEFPNVMTKREEAWRQRAEGLLQGKIPPPSEFVGYLVERIRGTKAERDNVLQALAQTERRLDMLRQERAALEGRFSGYMEDLRKWDKTPTEAPAPENKPPVAQA